jgi:hypothetical protein
VTVMASLFADRPFDHYDSDGMPRDKSDFLTTRCGHSLAYCHTNRCFRAPAVPAAFSIRFLAPPDFGAEEFPVVRRERQRRWVRHG